jgi:hypothetical protein
MKFRACAITVTAAITPAVPSLFAGPPAAARAAQRLPGTKIPSDLAAAYPEARPEIHRILSPAGIEMATAVANMCLPEATSRYAIGSSSDWTTTGQTRSSAIVANPTLNRLFEAQRIDVPEFPPVAPITCALHGLTGTLAPVPAADWITDRFAGVPAPNNCGAS